LEESSEAESSERKRAVQLRNKGEDDAF